MRECTCTICFKNFYEDDSNPNIHYSNPATVCWRCEATQTDTIEMERRLHEPIGENKVSVNSYKEKLRGKSYIQSHEALLVWYQRKKINLEEFKELNKHILNHFCEICQ